MQYERLLIFHYGNDLKKFFNLDYKQSYIECHRLDFIRELCIPDCSFIDFLNLTTMNLEGNEKIKLPESIGYLINIQQLFWLNSFKIKKNTIVRNPCL